MLAATADSVPFLCPDVPPGTPLSVRLENPAGTTETLQSVMQAATPGIFMLDHSTQGMILLDIGGVAAVRSYRVAGQPAQPGDHISIRATGMGAGSNIVAKLGDLEVPVESTEPVAEMPGAVDIHISIPAGVQVGNAVPVRLRVETAGKWSESNVATMAIELPRPSRLLLRRFDS